MTFLVAKGYVELGGARVSEVRGWDDSQSGSEVDTSIIGNVDSSGKPIKRTMPGAASQTLNLQLYYDPTDPAQSQLVQGATGLVPHIFTGGGDSGQERRVYNDCTVNTSTTTGSNFEGLVEYTVNFTVNGEIDRQTIA